LQIGCLPEDEYGLQIVLQDVDYLTMVAEFSANWEKKIHNTYSWDVQW
jgi:hypothetical protein